MGRTHQLLVFFCLVGLFSAAGLAQEPQSLGAIGVPDKDGIRITEIIPGGPAEMAGLKVGDVLTTIDDKPIRQITEKTELMSGKKAGSQLCITYKREDHLATATLKLNTSSDASPEASSAGHSANSSDCPKINKAPKKLRPVGPPSTPPLTQQQKQQMVELLGVALTQSSKSKGSDTSPTLRQSVRFATRDILSGKDVKNYSNARGIENLSQAGIRVIWRV